MKFLVAIAMFTLIGVSLTSAAAIETGENDTPESMEDFKENLKNLLLGISEVIKENAKGGKNIDLESLVPEIKIDGEESSIETEEEEVKEEEEEEEEEDPSSDEISADKNDDGIMSCKWTGRIGTCCKSFFITGTKIRLHVCLRAYIRRGYIYLILQLNGHTFWRHHVISRHMYRICFSKGHFTMCFYLYRLYISTHRVHGCLFFYANYRSFHFQNKIGCFYKRLGESEISANKETPLHFLENRKNTDDPFTIPKEINQSNDVFGFDQ